MNPTGGASAVNAMHDAAPLANWLFTLKSGFRRTHRQCVQRVSSREIPCCKGGFKSSQMFTRKVGKDCDTCNALETVFSRWKDTDLRFLLHTCMLNRTYFRKFVRDVMKRLLISLWRKILFRLYSARHQVSFLPLVEDNAKQWPIYQPSLHKTLSIIR